MECGVLDWAQVRQVLLQRVGKSEIPWKQKCISPAWGEWKRKAKEIYRETAAVVLADGAAVVADRAAVVVNGAAIVVDGAAVVVATARSDRAVDVFAPSCKLFNLSLNFNREGTFNYDLCQKSRYLELFSQKSVGEAGLRGTIVIRSNVLNRAGLYNT